MTKKIYLAGAIRNADDNEVGWRERVKSEYSQYEYLDPLDKINVTPDEIEVVDGWSDLRKDDTIGTEEIILSDLSMIQRSGVVLVRYMDGVEHVGTPMEMVYASERYNKTIVTWFVGAPIDSASPWLKYHSDEMVTSLDEAMRVID